MMNKIWFFLTAIGITVAALNGKMQAVSDGILKAATDSVTMLIGIAGIMAFWLGLMKIAEEAGLTALLGRALKPVLKRLFPEIPSEHPALGAIVMNFSANLLGLGNSATSFGIKAMQELQTLNPRPEKATRSMITLLVINTACITLIPTTLIGYRVSAGSKEPTIIVGTTLFATSVALVISLLVNKICHKISKD